jgi:multidrug efflux system outer membrane protein
MTKMKSIRKITCIILSVLFLASCAPKVKLANENKALPNTYTHSVDTNNIVDLNWREFFSDPYLAVLVDSALSNNQELNIILQEVSISKNEVKARKGEYLPSIGLGASAGLEKSGKFTRNGSVEENLNIDEDTKFPDPLPDYMFGLQASWEVDIWKKLRNKKKAAMFRYLASIEGRNFMVTNLVSEIAGTYYELLALDNQLDMLKTNLQILQRALVIVKMQKDAAKVTELAVRKFEAELLWNQSRQYEISQMIVSAENRINFLLGRFPEDITRDRESFFEFNQFSGQAGLPVDLLQKRPDIRQAELRLMAANVDVKAAKANFYPSLRITADMGYQAFNTGHLLLSPESIFYTLVGELMVPLVNRNAIKANYLSASSRQIQAVYEYEQTALEAYIEVANQLAKINLLEKSYTTREKQVEALTRSIEISTDLFNSARADYMEVLMTQRDALESKMELIETKRKLLNAKVKIYQALGGGWE